MTSSPFARATSACTKSLVMNRALFSMAIWRIIASISPPLASLTCSSVGRIPENLSSMIFSSAILRELLQFVEAREPYFAPVICLGFEFCDHCFRDDYCCAFVFTGLYHRGYAPVDEDACIWYQYQNYSLRYGLMLYYAIRINAAKGVDVVDIYSRMFISATGGGG